VLDGLDNVPAALKGSVVAIGNFDGCHRGHQHVFAKVRDLAARLQKPALVITFEPHPRDLFAPRPFLYRLTEAHAKQRLVEALGFDGIAIIPFDKPFASIEAGDFIKDLLVKKLGVSAVVVGSDFQFGKARAGTAEFLEAAGKVHGFHVEILDLLEEEKEEISSTRIRNALGSGDLDLANMLLGYHWIVEGNVIEGDRRGRDLGYPTANFELPANCGLAQGVYAVRAKADGGVYSGVASYGKPMFSENAPPFEAHLFDFDRDIYGKHVSVALMAYLRPQQTFDDIDALIKAMDRDARGARSAVVDAIPLSTLDEKLGYIDHA
jgi:riboflavin kinase/FMN adenylyltransferase